MKVCRRLHVQIHALLISIIEDKKGHSRPI